MILGLLQAAISFNKDLIRPVYHDLRDRIICQQVFQNIQTTQAVKDPVFQFHAIGYG